MATSLRLASVNACWLQMLGRDRIGYEHGCHADTRVSRRGLDLFFWLLQVSSFSGSRI
jgi:hypothetical protein